MAKLSVVVITYDRPTYVEAMLEALKLQTLKDFEVVISDDGSLSSPYEVVKRFEGKLDIKYIWQQDKPWNYCEARNLAIKISCGEVILFFDDDTIPSQRCVENHYKRHLAEGRGMVFGKMLNHPTLRPEEVKSYLLKQYPKDTTSRFRPLVKNFSVKRKEALAINGFDLDYSGYYGYEDSDFIKRLAKNGIKTAQADECEALAILAYSGHTNYSKSNERNYKLREKKMQEGKIVCQRGLEVKK